MRRFDQQMRNVLWIAASGAAWSTAVAVFSDWNVWAGFIAGLYVGAAVVAYAVTKMEEGE